MAPSGPLPVSRSSETPRSAANRRAAGDTLARPVAGGWSTLGGATGIGVASAAILAGVGVGVGVAAADDQEITGPAADQARTAALQAIPGKAGKVEKETNEGAAYYGVLVTKSDGSQVEVHLDQGFHFLGTEAPDND